MTEPVLKVEDLCCEFLAGEGFVRALDGVSLQVAPKEIVAIVGESGSGKSVLLQAILALVRGTPGVVAGQVALHLERGRHRPYEGIEQAVKWSLDEAGRTRAVKTARRFRFQIEKRARAFRGRGAALVLQNGRAALDPFWRVGDQLESALSGDARREKAVAWLRRLGFEDPQRVMGLRAHELSGGMAQRVQLAVVLAQEPQLLLLDEITTGLDVSLQASVLRLLKGLHEERGFSALLVTHDLGLAKSISSRTVIMQAGRVVQTEDSNALFSRRVALQPYTEKLLETVVASPSSVGVVDGAPMLEVDGVSKRFVRRGLFGAKSEVLALHNIFLSVRPGERVALVGESGSGKTTLSRLIIGLMRPSAGRVLIDGEALGSLLPKRIEKVREKRALLFQNPYTSLNPEITALSAVVEGGQSPDEARAGLVRLGLGDRADQRLSELSGGERRRVGLLRALSASAPLVVLDEPTAGLDAVHKEGVAKMIRALRKERPAQSLIIVSHDLGFLSGVADRVIVLYRGSVVEEAKVSDFMDRSAVHHPYTQLLWDASRYVSGQLDRIETMVIDEIDEIGEVDEDTEQGCVFRGRCPIYREDKGRWARCELEPPKLQWTDKAGRIACHGVGVTK